MYYTNSIGTSATAYAASDRNPALAAFNGRLYAAWIEFGYLNVEYSLDGRTWFLINNPGSTIYSPTDAPSLAVLTIIFMRAQSEARLPKSRQALQ